MWDAVLEQTDGLGLLHARRFSQFGDHRFRNVAIHVHHGESLAGLAGVGIRPPAKRKIGDVDFVFAKNRAHPPNHAGDVAVAHVDEVALQRSFGLDPIDVQQARRVVQHGAFYHVLLAAGFEPEGEHAVIVSRCFRFALFADPEAARRRNGCSVHQVSLLFETLIQDPFNRGIADEFRFRFGNVSRVAQRNFFQGAFAHLRQEGAQPFREHNIGLQTEILLMRNRRHVYGILNHTVFQVLLHLERDLVANCLLRLVGRAADVRGEQHVVHGL